LKEVKGVVEDLMREPTDSPDAKKKIGVVGSFDEHFRV
jgi:hypothetical protein